MQQDALVAVMSTTLKELSALCAWDVVDLATVNGISFDVYPWHEYCALSVRCGNERNEYNSADWKLHEFARTSEASSFATAAQWYFAADGGTAAQQCAHRIFCAAAQVLADELCPLLPSSLHGRLDAREFGFNHVMELMVFDVDATFHFNYCEYVAACRHTNLSHDGITPANVA